MKGPILEWKTKPIKACLKNSGIINDILALHMESLYNPVCWTKQHKNRKKF
jgi:hypothetical protein